MKRKTDKDEDMTGKYKPSRANNEITIRLYNTAQHTTRRDDKIRQQHKKDKTKPGKLRQVESKQHNTTYYNTNNAQQNSNKTRQAITRQYKLLQFKTTHAPPKEIPSSTTHTSDTIRWIGLTV